MSQVNDKSSRGRQRSKQEKSPHCSPESTAKAKADIPSRVDHSLWTEAEYLAAMDQLRDALLSMGGKVEASIADSVQAVIRRDSPLAHQVRSADRDINLLELDIDERCHRLLLARRPDPAQLRFITTALKIVVDLERIGDLAVNIALRALDLNEEPPLRPFFDLNRLADLGQAQLRDSLDAFVDSDADKAEQVLDKDDDIDSLYAQMNEKFVSMALGEPAKARQAMSLMFIAKQLERVGDHATNIAEMVIYLVRGVDIRHSRKG